MRSTHQQTNQIDVTLAKLRRYSDAITVDFSNHSWIARIGYVRRYPEHEGMLDRGVCPDRFRRMFMLNTDGRVREISGEPNE